MGFLSRILRYSKIREPEEPPAEASLCTAKQLPKLPCIKYPVLLLLAVLLTGCTPLPSTPTEAPVMPESTMPVTPSPLPSPTPLPLDTPDCTDSIRVGTFNIAASRMALPEYVGQAIQRGEADILGLQEVDVGLDRSYNIHQPAFFSLYADFPYYVFAPALGNSEKGYGIALLSKFPILESEIYDIPGLAELKSAENRVVLYCKIQLPDGNTLNVFNTHLPYENTTAMDLGYRGITAYLRQKAGEEDYLLLGDMNSEYPVTLRQLPELTAANTSRYSFRTKIIDNVFATKGLTLFGVNVYETATKFTVSDHQFTVCRVRRKA